MSKRVTRMGLELLRLVRPVVLNDVIKEGDRRTLASIAVPEGWDTDVSQMMFVDVREGTARVWTEVEDDRLYLIACGVSHPLTD